MEKKHKKEAKDMATVPEKLKEANAQVDLRIDDIWEQAENNLKRLEEEFRHRKGESNNK
ncbi:hypothetical protein ACFQMJ_21635 [Cohnella cellulosilytica]|uniref:Uncharacterized protein n=2 Tax=Cohnella cellulosilytica TaxID=986710 RepID=A0ABW2FD26_9BACL